MDVKEFYDQQTSTLTYIVFDIKTKDCVIIDPVLNYNEKTNSTSEESLNLLTDFITTNQLKALYILETHVHADHLSCSQRLKEIYPHIKLAINSNINLVQQTFKNELELNENFEANGSQFDLLLEDEQTINAGSLKIKVLFTPGHTPACTSFIINENIFTGDLIFMPDLGTGRCDFPGGSANDLFLSIKDKIYTLPDHYNIYVGHDYPPKGRALRFNVSVLEQKTNNKSLNINTSLEEFTDFRNKRDSSLNTPKLIEPSLKVNLNGGKTNYL